MNAHDFVNIQTEIANNPVLLAQYIEAQLKIVSAMTPLQALIMNSAMEPAGDVLPDGFRDEMSNAFASIRKTLDSLTTNEILNMIELG